jgi:Fe-S oxidoreductase/nitrate reductase gamma subunit
MTNLSDATRPLLWNIDHSWVMYLLFLIAISIFGVGMARRIQSWRRGKANDERLGDWGHRTWLLLRELLTQSRVRASGFPGLFHSLIFYSFLVLTITTTVVAFDADLGTTLFKGALYVALSVGSELAGVFLLIGVGMAAWRRLARPSDARPSEGMDFGILALLGLITLSGFAIEGLRIAVIGDPWVGLSPVGYLFSLAFQGLDAESGALGHKILWWGHCALSMGWIAAIPYTKFVHLIALPTNVFFQKLKPQGELPRPDLMALMMQEDLDEDAFNLGVEKASDFSWKQRLSFDACVSCGRCDEVCPAAQACETFSPRRFVARCNELVAAGDHVINASKNKDAAEVQPLVGEGFDEDFIWHCRTCMACIEVCPACIDHVEPIIEMRRNEVLWQGRMPSEAQTALRLLENKRNPFGPQGDRLAWVKELGVRIVAPGESVDVLYWIGCCIAFDPTKQKIAQDLCKLLERCGIDFGILGGDEKCCGDPARVLGEERLFQEIATEQIEVIKQRKHKLILTSCPHCYNVLKNEYAPFLSEEDRAEWNVVHHSEFLHEILYAGDITPRIGTARKIVYHDPCYIGRYQRMFDAPREVLRSLPGADVVEMQNHAEKSFCCGGGGGHFWMDLKEGDRINNLRVDQASEAGADTIVTGCAYCKQMLDDSIKMRDLSGEMEVVDLASLVLESLPAVETVPLPAEETPTPEIAKRAS